MATEIKIQPGLLRGAPRSTLYRWLLISSVLCWFAVLILVPAAALLARALRGGLGTFLAALMTPEAISAFALTLRITALATILNTVFGVAFALVLVRHRFWGRWLADGDRKSVV